MTIQNMEGAEALLTPLIRMAEANKTTSESDYINEDGIRICGVCGEPKETILQLNGAMKVPCVCRCDRERMQKEKEQMDKMQELERIKALKRASLMDRIYEHATFETFKETPENARNLRLAKHYAVDFNDMLKKSQGLLFYGNAGTGKSFTAACIANYLLDRDVPVIMTSISRLISFIESENGKELDIINRLKRAKLVIFDDLGVERNTDYVIEKTYNIIDSRVRSELPMIVTTNIPLEKLIHEPNYRFKRIYERILEKSHPMEFTGVSWRMRGAFKRSEEMEAYADK